MFTVDFETYGIDGPTSHRPPAPVGVSIKFNSQPSRYYAWGHPTDNTCTFADGLAALTAVWESGDTILFHNAPFDLAVAEAHMGLPWPKPKRIEDTMVQAYLLDPQGVLSLKPLSEKHLDLPSDEQDAVRQWLIDNGVVTASDRSWGAHIADAPGYVVIPYACGDTDRTYLLHEKFAPRVSDLHMDAAYSREIMLMETLHRATKHGICVDRAGLTRQEVSLSKTLLKADAEIRDRLDAPTLNVDANRELADALDKAGKIKEWSYTATGQRSTARDALIHSMNDPELAHLIAYRGQASTALNTFVSPWLLMSRDTGRLHPSWNQIRGEHGGGTRTGRLSCNEPNLQNVPLLFQMEPPSGYLPLPLMREYILPDHGDVLVAADYHSQEIRILGHYAEGAIADIYNNDPKADIHAEVGKLVLERTGLLVTRKESKTVLFSLLYGAGIGLIASRLGVGEDKAAQLVNVIMDVLTGVPSFKNDLMQTARRRETVRTWGGRVISAPRDKHGKPRDYALLNYLIQGSAADQTKDGIVEYDAMRKHGRFLATVHDEILISVPKGRWSTEAKILTDAMEKGKFDLPMRATVSFGETWGTMEKDS